MSNDNDKRPTDKPPEKPRRDEKAEQQQLVERRGLEFRNYLVGRADLIQRMCRPKSQLSALLLVRSAELNFRRDPKNLLEPKTWPTVLVALMTAAQLDLEPGGPLADAHLVPWWDNGLKHHVWSLMPGYRGLCKLAIQSGLVKRLRAFAVYAKDPFKIDQGSDPKVTHEVYTGADRGETIGAYAVARMVDDDDESEWMPWAEIERIKKAQEGRSPAWREWADQMARKLPLKRLCNQLPLGERFRLALEIDHATSDADTNALRRVVRDADIDPDGIIDTTETLALPTAKAASMADRIARREEPTKEPQTAKAPAPAKEPATWKDATKKRDDRPPAAEPSGKPAKAETQAALALDEEGEDHRCSACGVPVAAGDQVCEGCAS